MKPQTPIQRIQRAIASHYGITVADLLSRRRPQPLARIRQLAMWSCVQVTPNFQQGNIGPAFDRSRGDVIYAARKVKEAADTNKHMRDEAECVLVLARAAVDESGVAA